MPCKSIYSPVQEQALSMHLRLRKSWQSLVAECHGGLVFMFALFLPVMILAGLISVDALRLNHERVLLQETVDTLTLRVAREIETAGQRLTKADAVERLDALLASYFGNEIGEHRMTQYDANLDRVVATVEMDVPMFFGGPAGIWDSTIAATSEVVLGGTISPQHVILVLDISTSMAGAPIANLRQAATNVLQEIRETTVRRFDGDDDMDMLVSIVPFYQYVANPNQDYFAIGAQVRDATEYYDLENFLINLEVRTNIRYPKSRFGRNFLKKINISPYNCNEEALLLAQNIYRNDDSELPATIIFMSDWDGYCRTDPQIINTICPSIIEEGNTIVSVHYSSWGAAESTPYAQCSSPGLAFAGDTTDATALTETLLEGVLGGNRSPRLAR